MSQSAPHERVLREECDKAIHAKLDSSLALIREQSGHGEVLICVKGDTADVVKIGITSLVKDTK